MMSGKDDRNFPLEKELREAYLNSEAPAPSLQFSKTVMRDIEQNSSDALLTNWYSDLYRLLYPSAAAGMALAVLAMVYAGFLGFSLSETPWDLVSAELVELMITEGFLL